MRAKFLLPLGIVFLSSISAGDASPAFTRQTGAACSVCHFQDMRSLNAYGREFLQNSFHETEKMLRERREMEGKVKQGDKADDGPPARDAVHLNGHLEDRGEIEPDADDEMNETPEQEAIESQGRQR